MLTDEKDAPSTETATAGEESETGSVPSERRAPRRRRPRPALLVAGVLVVLLVAGAVGAGFWWNAGRESVERREAAVSAAQDMAVALVSVSSETADADVRR